jgi:hypothetical protein
MFEMKPLSPAAIHAALTKAERYRLLNEASDAESICLDVLSVESGNQDALIMLLLSLTDQFAHGGSDLVSRARGVLPRLADPYERAYYAGIICERRAKAILQQGRPDFRAMAQEWFVEAMGWYENAERIRPAGNDDALLRWNACARILNQRPRVVPRDETYEPQFLE